MISWNSNGNLVEVSTKNKFLNIFDPRKNKMIFKQIINDDFIHPKFGQIDNNLFATMGYDDIKSSKILKLWDVRKLNNN